MAKALTTREAAALRAENTRLRQTVEFNETLRKQAVDFLKELARNRVERQRLWRAIDGFLATERD